MGLNYTILQMLAEGKNCSVDRLLGSIEATLYIYFYPVILAASFVGNFAALVIYQHPFLRDSTTVRMLCGRSVANALFGLSMMPNYLFYFDKATDTESGQLNRVAPDDMIASFYYFTLKHVLFMSNTFSTTAVWLTVAVTAEHFLLVVAPLASKRWCTMRTANTTLVVVTALSTLLHSFNLWSRSVITLDNCTYAGGTYRWYLFVANQATRAFDQPYFWLSMCCMQVVPFILLIVFSSAIYYRLIAKGKKVPATSNTTSGGGKASSSTTAGRANEQKQCVTRLSLATTACHLLLELPQIGALAVAGTRGAATDGLSLTNVMTAAMGNFLSMVNSAVPFFVYLACSSKFRQLAAMIFCSCLVVLSEADVAALDARIGGGGRTSSKAKRNRSSTGRSFNGSAAAVKKRDKPSCADVDDVLLQSEVSMSTRNQVSSSVVQQLTGSAETDLENVSEISTRL